MGAEIGEFVVASNRNAILTQFFRTGAMTIGEVQPSLSPSMDIQVSSNLERLLFELLDSDGQALDALMGAFRRDQHVALPLELLPRLQESWVGESLNDEETILDPHTAVGVGAARRRPDSMPRAVMATAHPAKFPDAVERATGIRPELPDHLADLFEREEHYTVLPNDLEAAQAFVESSRNA
jgi:threonine synthase